MHDVVEPPVQDPDALPGLGALLGQLADDSRAFARAEFAFLRAEAGERVTHAVPGIALLVISIALALGTIGAMLVGLILLLATLLGLGWAVALVCGLASASAFACYRIGIARLRNALKTKEER